MLSLPPFRVRRLSIRVCVAFFSLPLRGCVPLYTRARAPFAVACFRVPCFLRSLLISLRAPRAPILCENAPILRARGAGTDIMRARRNHGTRKQATAKVPQSRI